MAWHDIITEGQEHQSNSDITDYYDDIMRRAMSVAP